MLNEILDSVRGGISVMEWLHVLIAAAIDE
jgi:hypothetical protein